LANSNCATKRGSVLVFSHDRYFLDRTVSRIVLLEKGKLKEYIGGYSDYAEKSQCDSHLTPFGSASRR
jgi:ATPase subunit of ABC transporter with duplicated ATPase domains